jgi:hypothetical protein
MQAPCAANPPDRCFRQGHGAKVPNLLDWDRDHEKQVGRPHQEGALALVNLDQAAILAAEKYPAKFVNRRSTMGSGGKKQNPENPSP